MAALALVDGITTSRMISIPTSACATTIGVRSCASAARSLMMVSSTNALLSTTSTAPARPTSNAASIIAFMPSMNASDAWAASMPPISAISTPRKM